MEIGQLLFFNGDIDRAINAFHQAAELNPKAFEPYVSLISLYAQKGDPESLAKAEDACREVLKRKPGHRDAHLMLGNLLRNEANLETSPESQKKKLEEAVKELQAAEEAGASEALCENTIGATQLQIGEYGPALEHIDHALKKQSNYPDAHLLRAVLLFRAANKDPNNPDQSAFLNSLKSPENKEKLDEILHEFDLAVEQKNGVNPEALNTKAEILFALGRYPEALESYKKAASQEANLAQAWAGVGNCEAQLASAESDEAKKNEHISAAKDAYDKAKKLKPTDKNIVYGLAIMLEKMGRQQDALQQYQEALMMETDPVMKAQINLHLQQLMGGALGDLGHIGGGATGGVGSVGNSLFTSGALSQPFANLIKIKSPGDKDEDTKKEKKKEKEESKKAESKQEALKKDDVKEEDTKSGGAKQEATKNE